MDTRDLEVFISVASHGSFIAAARERDVDASTISRSIRNLETDLGARLFYRTTRSLSLTEVGETYLSRIKPLVGELEHALDEVHSSATEPKGTIRFTSSIAYAERKLVKLLPEYKKRFSLLEPELVLSDENLDLTSNRIDLALRLGTKVQGDLVVSRCADTQYFVCASPDYLAGNPALEMPSDLKSHKCLVFTIPNFRDKWFFKSKDERVFDIDVQAGMAISNALALRRAAIEGLGPALLADWLIEDDLRKGRLVKLFPEYGVTATSFDTAVWFVYPSRNYVPYKVRVTIDFLRQALVRR